MRPEQEDSLPLPDGYCIVAMSRPDPARLRRAYGGIAAVINTDVIFEIMKHSSAPDLLVLDLPDLYIIGSYLLPSGSNWRSWSEVNPETRLREAVTLCCAMRTKPVVVMADLNGRTGSKTPPGALLPRRSLDPEVNVRGRWVLELCGDNQLEILNGSNSEMDSPGALTSFQASGSSVIDYVLISQKYLSMAPPGSLHVVRDDDWSDHARLSLHLHFSKNTPPPKLTPAMSLAVSRSAPHVNSELTPCDILVAEAVATVRTPLEATTAIYGPVLSNGPRVQVYVASSCRGAGRIDARAACGIYWGRNSRFNSSVRISGAQTENRAAIVGILAAVTSAPADRCLDIHSTSKYAIRSFCYWAGENYTRGWDCANGDILAVAVEAMRRRPGAVHFTWIDPNDGGDTPEAARKLAALGTSSNDTHVFETPPDLKTYQEPASGWNVDARRPKVSTSLLPEDPPKPKSSVMVSAADLAIGEKVEAHRSRAKYVPLMRMTVISDIASTGNGRFRRITSTVC